MPPEFGTNGHHPEDSRRSEPSILELVPQMRRTIALIRERKPDGVKLKAVNMYLYGAYMERMEERHIMPLVKKNFPAEGESENTSEEATWDSFKSLGMIIHDPMQLRVDFTATPGEVATLPTELQDFFPEMGLVFFKPLDIALVKPYSDGQFENFGVVITPPKLEGDRVGVILSSDQKCEPSVIGNGTSHLRRLHLTQKMQTMRNNDPVDHEYTRLMTSTGFWVVGILNERMDYC